MSKAMAIKDPEASVTTGRQPSPAVDSEYRLARNDGAVKPNQHRHLPGPDPHPRTKQANACPEIVSLLTDQAELQMGQAQPRTEPGAKNELALRASELGYRRLFEAARHGILILEGDSGRIRDVNPFLVELLGVSHREMVGKLVGELSAFKELESNQLMLERLRRDGWVRYQCLPLATRDGRPLVVEFVSNLYLVGGHRAIQCHVRDLTERTRMENQLQPAQKEIGDLPSALDPPASVALTDPQGRITAANESGSALSQAAREELLNPDHRRRDAGLPSAQPSHEICPPFSLGKVWKGELLNRDEDGAAYWVDTTIVPFLNEQGKPLKYVVIRADITERKAAKDKIRQLNVELEQRVVERTVQLEAANQELEAFSYSVSHDLRAPLRHVLGFVALLRTEAGAALSPKCSQHLATICESAQRMGRLIDALLAFSRIGKSEMRKTAVPLDQLVKETVGGLAAEIQGRDIAWTIHPLPVVWADRALLHLALVNLVANAVKFTGNRRAAKIEIGCAPGADGASVVFIRDNGVGFDPRYADKLFGVFQRLHGLDEFDGTGIGLANVQRVIQRHGGRVWAEGAVNHGATFYFSLPPPPASAE